MKKITLFVLILILISSCTTFSQNKTNQQTTLVNQIQYYDTSFTDLPGNGFLIDIGDEILAVTCKHVFWENRQKDMKTISINGKIVEWKMIDKNDTSQYIILGDLINSDENEIIGERNTEKDFLVFKIKENHSNIKPLKLAVNHVQSGDTLYKTGRTFAFKNVEPKIYKSTVQKYAGSNLLCNMLVYENIAGLSGSPVTNKDGELVGIVSSWYFDLETENWYESPCSTDYLWQILYQYWLEKNKKAKSIDSFNDFLKNYEKLNSSNPEISDFVYTELFFTDWLKSQNYEFATTENFNEWTKIIKKNYNIDIVADNYRKSILIFDSWKQNYLSEKADIQNLEQLLTNENLVLPDLMNFYDLSMELTKLGTHDKAIEILLFADKIFQHSGQLYAYLGDHI